VDPLFIVFGLPDRANISAHGDNWFFHFMTSKSFKKKQKMPSDLHIKKAQK